MRCVISRLLAREDIAPEIEENRACDTGARRPLAITRVRR
jgi:hypothetical protein